MEDAPFNPDELAAQDLSGSGAFFGADISHRGGRPGFIRVDGDVLTIPDFPGNRYFNTRDVSWSRKARKALH